MQSVHLVQLKSIVMMTARQPARATSFAKVQESVVSGAAGFIPDTTIVYKYHATETPQANQARSVQETVSSRTCEKGVQAPRQDHKRNVHFNCRRLQEQSRLRNMNNLIKNAD